MLEDILIRAKRLPTATLADALDHHGVHGIMSGIPRRAGEGRIAGYARTMQEHVGPLGTYAFSDFTVGAGFDDVERDTVLVVDMGGADVSTFGGLASLALSRKHAAAAIIDGGCRDIEEIRSSGLTVASRYVTPRTGKRRLKVVSRGQPVTCGGVAVRQSDLVVADDTGVVVIPSGMVEKILGTAEKLDRQDAAFADELRADKSFADSASALQHA